MNDPKNFVRATDKYSERTCWFHRKDFEDASPRNRLFGQPSLNNDTGWYFIKEDLTVELQDQ